MLVHALACAFAVLAQQATPSGETVVELPRPEGSATDTDVDRIVVTREQLEATGERSLPRMLGKAAGVWIQETNLGGGAPIIQGKSGNAVLLVIDGVRMNDSTTRNGVNQMLNGVDPASVERIEVIRGPRTVLFGSDALGGVVLITTKRRAPLGDADGTDSLRSALELGYQSATNGVRGSAELSDAYASNAWFAVGSYHEWNEIDTADGKVDNTGYAGQAYFGSWNTALDSNHGLRATLSITKDFDVPRTDRLNAGFGQTQASNAEYEFAIQDRQRLVLSYSDTEAGVLADELEVRTSFRYYNEDRHIRNLGSTTRRNEHDTTNTLGLGVDLRKALGASHKITYGIDVDYDEVDSGRVDEDINTGVQTPKSGSFAPGSHFLSSGAFVQDELLAFEPFDVTLGLRYGFFDFGFRDATTNAREEGDFDALSGSLAVGREIADGVRLVGTVARGFRAPNLAEVARDATFFGGTELHNPDLDAETTLYGELALEMHRATWNAALAVFHDNVSDVVGSRLVNAGGPGIGDETYLRDNVGTLEVVGVLASGRTQWGGVDSPWSSGGTAEWTYGKQYDDFVDIATGTKPFNDQPAQRIPPLHGWVDVRYDMARRYVDWCAFSVNWALEQERLSPQDLGDPRIDPNGTDAWVTFDLDLSGQVGWNSGSTWNLGIHNLLDESYRVHGSGFDGPGLGFVVGVRVSR